MKLSPSQVIVLATPVFFLLIAVEVAYGRWRGRNTYRLNDAINSISLGMLSQISAVLTRLFRSKNNPSFALHRLRGRCTGNDKFQDKRE